MAVAKISRIAFHKIIQRIEVGFFHKFADRDNITCPGFVFINRSAFPGYSGRLATSRLYLESV